MHIGNHTETNRSMLEISQSQKSQSTSPMDMIYGNECTLINKFREEYIIFKKYTSKKTASTITTNKKKVFTIAASWKEVVNKSKKEVTVKETPVKKHPNTQ